MNYMDSYFGLSFSVLELDSAVTFTTFKKSELKEGLNQGFIFAVVWCESSVIAIFDSVLKFLFLFMSLLNGLLYRL